MLGAGTKLGPYDILSPLGAGGFGEVYKARDTRLDRTVAIKVLPETLAADSDRIARFEREAKTLAALNQPHIAQIYGLEESNGVRALVMELVDGPTLADRIAQGPIPLDEALPIAKQIAEALEAAHEQGIIHRDLKPANIAFTSSGQVKVLDFGLAKALDPVVGSDLSDSPTLTLAATQAGVVLGTAAYMAPEQARGKSVDKRADIWAFGCVLYEMFVGTPAFRGDTLTDIIAAVVKNEPNWTLLPADTPVRFRWLLGRCLVKGPDQRLHDIADARIELDDIAATPVDGAPAVHTEQGHSLRWRERVAWILAAFALLAAFLGWVRRPALPAPPRIARLSILPPEKTSFSIQNAVTVGVPQLELSPDGRAIVFAAVTSGGRPSLWLRSFDSTTAQPLTGTEGAEYPFWSPDGAWVGFFADGKLKKVPVTGGPSQLIANDIPDPRYGSWGADDTILFSRGMTPVLRVSAAGGAVTRVTQLDTSRQEGSHRFPQFLPDGKHFIFQLRSSVPDYTGVYAGSLDGRTKKLLIQGQTSARYASDHLFFPDGDTLMAQAFDADRLELRGRPVVVGEHVGRSSMGTAAYSLSSDGTLAYANTLSAPSRLTWFDRTGKPVGVVGPVADYTDFRFSPDESRLTTSLADPKTGFPDVWLLDLARGINAPCTFGPALNAGAVWSPDGSKIVFRTTRSGGLTEFYSKSSGCAGKEQPVLTLAVARAAGLSPTSTLSDWSPDGRYLLFSTATGADYDLWVTPVTGESKPASFLSAPGDQWHGNFAPEGHLVAYSSSESGRFEIHVQTFPLSDWQSTISTDGGYEPRWRGDGREIYYLSPDQTLMAVTVGPGPSFGRPNRLFQTPVPAGVNSQRTHYVPSRDGQRFLISAPVADQAPAMSITVVLNATAALR
jgi:serine/threonine protein kinase